MHRQHHELKDGALHHTSAAAAIWVGNPFAHEERERAHATGVIENSYASVPELAEKMVVAGHADDGRRLLLAAANWHVFERHSRSVLPLEQVLESKKAFGLKVPDFRRLVQALERFYARIDSLAGTSDCVHNLKVEAWRCCFGESLETTLALEDTIVAQNVLITGETGTG